MQITPVALRPATKKPTAPTRQALPQLPMPTLSRGIGPEPPVLLSSKEIVKAARAELQAADEQVQAISYSAPPPSPATQAPAPESLDRGEAVPSSPAVMTVPNLSRQPKKMSRAKSWSPEVENLFRYQSAGYRDATEYLMANERPDFWPESMFVRCLKSKDTACFMYFRQHRECIDSFLNKIKVYSY